MDRDFLTDALKRNWYLLVVLAVLPIAALVIAGNRKNADDSGTLQGAQAATLDQDRAGNSEDFSPGPFKPRSTSHEKTLATIADYEAFNRANPNDAMVPHNLERMGNLYYSTLHDFENAIQKYETLVSRYPDYKNIKDIYPNLAAAYENTRQFGMAQETYRRMVEYYPPGSSYHGFAQMKLSGNG